MLDLGCGLGNLAIAAARQGCHVVGVDASLPAIVHIVEVSRAENLGMTVVFADVSPYRLAGAYATIVAIGLLMFMRREAALETHFAGWKIEPSCHDALPAPGDTVKQFSTVIARKPAGR